MKLATIFHVRESTRHTYEAAGTIRHRLAWSEAKIEGWKAYDATVEVWKVLGRGKGYGVTPASIETARAKALREAETLPLEDEHLATEIRLVNGVHDTAVDVLAALDACQKAKGGDPNEVAALVDDAESADGLARDAHGKLARINTALTVRGLLDTLFTRLEADLCGPTMTREQAEQSIRAMVFEDKS